MKRATLIITGLAFLLVSVGQAKADVIAGPSSFPVQGGNDTTWGIQFTALDNSTLTSFTFTHHTATFGNFFTGTIALEDITTSTTVFTTPYGNSVTGSPEVITFSGLSVSLNAGDVYQLVATGSGIDERYAYDSTFGGSFSYPDSNSDLSVTQGVFNNNPGFQETYAWGAFTNLTTAAAPVPEPTSLALFGMSTLFGAAYCGWRRRRQMKAE